LPPSKSLLDLELNTAFILDDHGRIVSTREPQATRGPLFTLIRTATRCTWAVRAGLLPDVTAEIDRLAREEPPTPDLQTAPAHADRYQALLGDRTGLSGYMFAFPQRLPHVTDAVLIEDERLLQHHFHGWEIGEIAAGRAPVLAIVEGGYPVSVCFCARESDAAAAAGLETAERFRGRGLARRVTAAWASAIRASGRIPLYSTASTNHASRSVARRLNLTPYASTWSISD
jgi:hypothetical protein